MTAFSEASPDHTDMLERALDEAGLGYWREPSPGSSLTLGVALAALVALNPEAMMPVDDFASWRSALAGGKPSCVMELPWCGYFRARDHKATKMDGRRWPTVACAIWRAPSGELKAERAGQDVPVEWIWPWCATKPISHEEYVYWHSNHTWPAKEAVTA
jgi:hypothetical protein